MLFSGGEYEGGHAGADNERADGARDDDGLLAFGSNLYRWGMNDLILARVGDALRGDECQAHQDQENAIDPQPQSLRASHLLHASRQERCEADANPSTPRLRMPARFGQVMRT